MFADLTDLSAAASAGDAYAISVGESFMAFALATFPTGYMLFKNPELLEQVRELYDQYLDK